MKVLLALPLLLTLASCKYDSLDKIIVGENIQVQVEGDRNQMNCLDKQLNAIDWQISQLKKAQRIELAALIGSKVNRIIIREDNHAKTIRGVSSSLSQVGQSCSNNQCRWIENATKKLKDETTVEGSDPEMKITMEGNDLIMQAEYLKDLSVHKKYYTRSVETYDVVEELEVAINDRNIWSQPTQTGDQKACAKNIDLNKLLEIIKG